MSAAHLPGHTPRCVFSHKGIHSWLVGSRRSQCREQRDGASESEAGTRFARTHTAVFRRRADAPEALGHQRAERGELAFGTIDCFLVWRLTKGQRHVTDVSNASRTLIFDIHQMDWSESLLAEFGVPRQVLPEVAPSAGESGEVQGLAC